MLKSTIPYFVLDGHADEALKFYADVLQATIEDITYFGDMPADPDFPMTDDLKDLVLNASIRLPNGDIFMFSDNMPDMPFTIGNQISTALVFDDVTETRAAFEKLSEGGQVDMPLQETFWSPLYGNLTDQYGNKWQIDTEIETNITE